MEQNFLSLIVCYALTALLVLVFGRIILSWFPPGGATMESVQRFVFGATEWLMAPLRRVLPPLQLGGAALDLSPLVVILGISLVQRMVC